MGENTRMEIWNQVCKTDPKHTKQVRQRGGFTSIDAMYQVQRATEVFGPCGLGWGYEASYSELVLPDAVVMANADVTLWYRPQGSQAQASYGPVRGCNVLQADSGRVDDDAWKKAMTDALTKALSQLGFSADVFLGMYDDDKYVAGLKSEFEKKRAAITPEVMTSLVAAVKANDPEQVKAITEPLSAEQVKSAAMAMGEETRDSFRKIWLTIT